MVTAPLAVAIFCLTTHRAALPSADAPSLLQHSPAEPAPPSEGAVQVMKDGKAQFELLDTDGVRHRASLVQIDGDSVTLQSRGDVFIVPVDQFQRSSRRGDRPWDGALVGFSVGVGLWALIAQNDSAGGFRWKSDNPDDWTIKDTLSLLAFSTTVGYIVDALHVGKHVVFVAPKPAASRRPPALTLAVTGRSRERQLQIGYRVKF